MEVNDALIQKLAMLSKFRFTENEKLAIQIDLQRMIQFVQKMEEVNTDAVEPLLHMSAAKNISRKDLISGTCEHKDALLNAQQHNHQFFLVPKVIKK
ncbi:MAG: Asp-tRNA(Asn)/Glu-tRNA(Gln) amidotransferase subunit GatC [Ferruginibacter sp.]